MCQNGVRSLLVMCFGCRNEMILNVDQYPGDLLVREFGPGWCAPSGAWSAPTSGRIGRSEEMTAPIRGNLMRVSILIARCYRTISSPYFWRWWSRGRKVPVQDHLTDKAKWYKAKAVECATLAKSARRSFIREIYRKAAVRYDFAEEVLRRRIEEVVTPSLLT
jgi:hypothetical protein